MYKIFSYSATIRILNNLGRYKDFTNCYFRIPLDLECGKSVSFTFHRIICTNTNQQALNKYNYKHEFIKDQETVCYNAPFLKENFNIIDTRYFKLISVPSEYYLEEFLKREEFKEILSRSPFTFDVNLPSSLNTTNFCIQNLSLDYISDLQDYKNYGKNYVAKASETSEENTLCSKSDMDEKKSDKPTEQQLLFIIDRLTYSLLNFFEKPHDYSIYHKNIVFQNHIREVTTKGLTAYIQAMYILKIYGLLHYAKVKVEILKITHHIEDGTVRARWRVNGISRKQLLINIWKSKKIEIPQLNEDDTEWLDGFSIFSVGPDGLIYKHVCDKLTPSHEDAKVKKSLKSKLLGLIDLSPRAGPAGNLSALLSCYKNQFEPKKIT